MQSNQAKSSQVINQREDYIAMQEEVKEGDYLYGSATLDGKELYWYISVQYKDCKGMEHNEGFYLIAKDKHKVMQRLSKFIDNHPGMITQTIQTAISKEDEAIHYMLYDRLNKSFILAH